HRLPSPYMRATVARIPLLASPQGGVAERVKRFCGASADREAGVVFRFRTQRKTTPAASASVASQHFLDDAATPPCRDARRGIRRFEPFSFFSHVHRPPLQLTLALLMAVLMAALGASCSKAQTAQAEDLSVPYAPTVAVAKATVEDVSRGIVLTAEFKPFQEIDVMAKIAGYVKKINVDVGDRVKEGQLLALIEVPEMADDQ